MENSVALEAVAKIAKLSAEHFGCLDELTKSWLMREDGLTRAMKVVSLIHADIKHLKVLHLVAQAELNVAERVPFSQFLKHLALDEEQEEARVKGGG